MTMPIEVQEKLDNLKPCEQFSVLLADDTHAIVMGVDATGTVYGTHNNILITWDANGTVISGNTDKDIAGLNNDFVAYKNLSMGKVNLQSISHNETFYIWDNGKAVPVRYTETQYTHSLIGNGNAFKNQESATTFARIANSIMTSYGAHNEFKNHLLHNLKQKQTFKLANDKYAYVVDVHDGANYPVLGYYLENGAMINLRWNYNGESNIDATFNIVSEVAQEKRTKAKVPATNLVSGATVYTITPLFEVKQVVWFATQTEMFESLRQGNIFIRKVDAIECAHRLKGIVNGN